MVFEADHLVHSLFNVLQRLYYATPSKRDVFKFQSKGFFCSDGAHCNMDTDYRPAVGHPGVAGTGPLVRLNNSIALGLAFAH